ncbi:BrnT family toxin [Halomonas llamarensis]|uniref:BrnT family toxin n=1 Tax=Halomonas llamarensis TaxID=2945104 RepID=A0ABT0SLJ8_9GAMM|nr:BrnT family toxin [Halomonas llamarensis]MCL7928675.1 BrnT family toxin [Halomonas llamarensis]
MSSGCDIEYDLRKQQATLAHRGLDFHDAPNVFAGKTLAMIDDRQNYGEERIITVGTLLERIVVIVWTPRGEKRRIISMRYANERERQRYAHHLV